jgi:hypothetical protein
MTTNDGSIRSDRCSFLYQRVFVFVLADDLAARIDYVRKNHRRAAKDVILQLDTRVQRDVVLNFHVIADSNSWANDDVLAQVATTPQACSSHDMRKMPNLCAYTDFARFIDRSCGVCEIARRIGDDRDWNAAAT